MIFIGFFFFFSLGLKKLIIPSSVSSFLISSNGFLKTIPIVKAEKKLDYSLNVSQDGTNIAKGKDSVCVGDCPKDGANEFCWPINSVGIGQFPYCGSNNAAVINRCAGLTTEQRKEDAECEKELPCVSHSKSDAVDIAMPAGTPIYAPVSGNYVFSKGEWSNGANVGPRAGGCSAKVDFEWKGQTYSMHFAHMPYENTYNSKHPVTGTTVLNGDCKVGEFYLSAGEQLGVVNNTGNSSGNHLHWGISGGARRTMKTSLIWEIFNDGIAGGYGGANLETAASRICGP